jgi:hypothetical protein
MAASDAASVSTTVAAARASKPSRKKLRPTAIGWRSSNPGGSGGNISA